MPKKTVEELMKLLAIMTGWSDQSLSVTIGYKAARGWDANTEWIVDDKDWGFVVATTICGAKELDVSAQGKTLEDALFALAKNVQDRLLQLRKWYDDKANFAIKTLKEWEVGS